MGGATLPSKPQALSPASGSTCSTGGRDQTAAAGLPEYEPEIELAGVSATEAKKMRNLCEKCLETFKRCQEVLSMLCSGALQSTHKDQQLKSTSTSARTLQTMLQRKKVLPESLVNAYTPLASFFADILTAFKSLRAAALSLKKDAGKDAESKLLTIYKDLTAAIALAPPPGHTYYVDISVPGHWLRSCLKQRYEYAVQIR